MKNLINFYKRLSFIQGAIFVSAISSVMGLAATVTGLNTFSAGTPISSSQMNTNFSILKTAIESTSTQTYVGTHDASTTIAPTATTVGEYYVISAAGTINGVTYAVGDWIIFNGTIWEKIPSTSAVTSVFGRTGVIIATEADYNLDKLADVDTATLPPSTGQALLFNGTLWTPGNISVTETDPTVMPFATMALPFCSTGQVLTTTGSIFSCVTDNPGTAPFLGTPSKIIISDGVGALSSSTIDSALLANIVGVTTPIQAQLDSKLSTSGGMLSVGTISGVPNPVNLDEVVNKGYVDSFGQWILSGPNIYYPSGSVGIGTPSPAYTLHVNGTVAGTSAFVTASDKRFKRDIATIPNALEKLLSIDGVTYQFKTEKFPDKNFSKRREMGVIAQKVESVFPEAVSADKGGFKSVAYSMLIAPIIESLREMDTRTKELEVENKMLKSYLCSQDPSAPFCQ